MQGDRYDLATVKWERGELELPAFACRGDRCTLAFGDAAWKARGGDAPQHDSFWMHGKVVNDRCISCGGMLVTGEHYQGTRDSVYVQVVFPNKRARGGCG